LAKEAQRGVLVMGGMERCPLRVWRVETDKQKLPEKTKKTTQNVTATQGEW